MRYVIIGSGNISDTYVRAIQAIDGSSIVACVSRRGNRPVSGAALPVCASLADVTADYDAVIVATPNGLHHQGVIAAAKQGKHVITEKPLDISVAAMNAAIAACEKAGVTLAVAFQRRFAPDNAAVQKLIEAKAFGRIFAADLSAKFYRPQSYYDSGDYRGGFEVDGGGPFMQQACHNLDIYSWFFGPPVKVVSMLDRFAHDIEVEDHGAALMRHADGMIGTVVASTATKPGFAARLEVHTENGSFTLTDDIISDWQVEGVPNPTDPDFDYAHNGATSAAVTDTRGHQAVIKDFEDAVAEKRLPRAHPASARLSTELILAIYQSAVS